MFVNNVYLIFTKKSAFEMLKGVNVHLEYTFIK
jgi:hypothetical protein